MGQGVKTKTLRKYIFDIICAQSRLTESVYSNTHLPKSTHWSSRAYREIARVLPVWPLGGGPATCGSPVTASLCADSSHAFHKMYVTSLECRRHSTNVHPLCLCGTQGLEE